MGFINIHGKPTKKHPEKSRRMMYPIWDSSYCNTYIKAVHGLIGHKKVMQDRAKAVELLEHQK